MVRERRKGQWKREREEGKEVSEINGERKMEKQKERRNMKEKYRQKES